MFCIKCRNKKWKQIFLQNKEWLCEKCYNKNIWNKEGGFRMTKEYKGGLNE